MAGFSKTIKSKYDLKTYESTKKAVEWILLTLKKLNLSNEKPRVKFLFSVGDISCSCESMEDFIEHVYGQKEFHIIDITITQLKKTELIFYVSLNSDDRLHISTSNKNTLDKIIECLEKTSFDDIIDKKDDSKIKRWVESIIQNLLANGIWAIIVLVITAILAYFGFHK